MHERNKRAYRDALIKLHAFFGTHDWCTHVRARDVRGIQTYETDPKAVQWCAVGALGLMGFGHLEIEVDTANEISYLVDLNNDSLNRAEFLASLTVLIAELAEQPAPAEKALVDAYA